MIVLLLILENTTRPREPPFGRDLCQLSNHHDHAVAPEQSGRSGVQCVRAVLQTAQRQPPAHDEEGRHPDAQAQTKI